MAKDGALQILLDSKPFSTFTYRDADIGRPYFANVMSPHGVKITRNHPPAADDPQDHEKMHPGVWLAFGDLSGADSWRLAAPIEHIKFTNRPVSEGTSLTFGVSNRYLTANGEPICLEDCNYRLLALRQGVLLLTDSRFYSPQGSFAFGDQEELGLGVRLARTVAVDGGLGGRILNSNAQVNEEQAWGQQADWCDYSGPAGNAYVGIMIMPHPENFRRSWCHCRNTGFMAMNPFGRNAFTGAEKSKVVVSKGGSLRLRYGVLFHWNERAADFDPDAAYEDYQRRSKAN